VISGAGANLPKALEEEEDLIINEDIKVIEFAPDVFSFLRQIDNIDHEAILKSLHPDFNRESVFRAGESQGKSGSFFFFSHDKNFIIKTMTDSDMKTFMNMFEEYFPHVSQNQKSMLARIYGVYTVQMEEIEPVHLILMGNTKKSNDKLIEHVFDLKGSFINREVKGKNLKNTATLKDINLLNLCKDKMMLRFNPADIEEINHILEKDSMLLRAHNVMDYSLLLGVENNPAYSMFKGGKSKTTKSSGSENELLINEESKS
jgi:1-phosphatidylinositol-4-phosphate 5-kinase